MFTRLLQGLVRRLPSQCAVCRAWPSRPVCEACVTLFAQPVARCDTCALPVPAQVRRCGACLVKPPPLDACLAALPYAYPWSGLVADFKFQHHPAWATSFALLLRSAPWVEPALDATDLLIALPLSKERLRERGYNQAQLLAQALDTPKLLGNVLLRIQHTPPQRSLPRKDRLHNVTHAFAVDPLRATLLRGKRVVLLDDVMTTGASLHAAARTLRAAGATHITGLVLARTE
ncbi:MAG: ComF family protein [Rhodoferax sp.]|nr:ComF family protein [Rhodoferax sp.]MCF8207855.1 ComF family protein [Rhodoferax sp.]